MNEPGEMDMFTAIGFALATLFVLSLRLLTPPRPLKDTGLGWVSERWLAEHRAGESSPVG